MTLPHTVTASTPQPGPMAVRPAEAARLLSVTRRTLDRMVLRGDVRATRVGGCVLVPVRELERLLSDRVEG